jgi:AbrB family looped-hinge helix DNA binding protein
LKEYPVPTATLTSKGQITIPLEVRIALGLKIGDKIDFVEIEEGQYAIKPRTASIRDLEGCIAKLDHVPTIEEMNEAILDCAAENFLATVANSAHDKPHGEAA